MKCPNCDKDIGYIGAHAKWSEATQSVYYFCPVGATDRGTLQGFASSSGSASAAPSVQEPQSGMGAPDVRATSSTVKEDESGVVNSVVQLPVSDLLASLIQTFESREIVAEKQEAHFEIEGNRSVAREWGNRKLCWNLAVKELKDLARSAPSAAGASGGS